jgi:predicted ABC-class ATPase
MAAKKAGRQVGSRLLSRFLVKLNDTTPLREYMALTTAEVDTNAKEKDILYWKFKKEQATESRATWLEQLAESRAKHEQQRMNKFSKRCQREAHYQRKKQKLYTSAQELKKLRATEELCQIYCNINYAVGKDKLAGISLVIAPNRQGEWIECTSKDEIEDACIEEGQRRFHQTAGTPPMTAPLNIQLG